jgi:hypothetical protein
MRLHELFESPFTQPGILPVLNVPQTAPAVGQNVPAVGQNSANITVQPGTVAPITSQPGTPTPNVASTPGTLAQPNTTATPPDPAAIARQYPINSIQKLPIGQGSVERPMRVTAVADNNTAIKGQKAVTFADPNNPNAPQQTYPASVLPLRK